MRPGASPVVYLCVPRTVHISKKKLLGVQVFTLNIKFIHIIYRKINALDTLIYPGILRT